MSHSPEPHLAALRPYLERPLPGQVRHSWWEEAARDAVFAVAHETARPLVLVERGFLQACHDASASLHASELADSIRETRARAQRLRVLEAGGTVSIRSTAL